MAKTVNTYDELRPSVQATAAKRFLKRGKFMMVTEMFGFFDEQPRKATDTKIWRRYESLPRAEAPISDGIPPKGTKMRFTDIQATLEQYGDFVPITNKLSDIHTDPVLMTAMDLCGEAAAETVEVIRIAFLKAGSNVFYANNAAGRSTVNSPPTGGDFKRIFRAFKKLKGKEISKVLTASHKISTEPVEPSYFVMGHTDLLADLEKISGWLKASQYSSYKPRKAEYGAVDRFRFVLTALFDPWEAAGATGTTFLSSGVAPTSGAAADVYPLICVAQDGYAIVPLAGKASADIGAQSPGIKTPQDPIGQQGFASWNIWQAGAILNQNWVARLECAATANPT